MCTGAAEANDDARLMELIEGLEPPDVSACNAAHNATSPRRHQLFPNRSTPPERCASTAVCSPQHVQATANGRELPTTNEESPEEEQQERQQPEAENQQGPQHRQQHETQLDPSCSGLFSMASSSGPTPANAIRRTTSAAYPSATYPPSRFAAGPGSFVRHSSTDISAVPVPSSRSCRTVLLMLTQPGFVLTRSWFTLSRRVH